MERLYDRQQNPTPNNEYDIAVIGVGGVGSWTAINLAMSGMCRTLWLMDGDEIERSNLNRLPYSEDAIGERKTDKLQSWINTRRPNLPVASISEFLDESNIDDLKEFDGTNASQLSFDGVLFCADGSDARDAATEAFPALYEMNRLLFFGAEGDEVSFFTTHESWDFGEEQGYDDIWVGNAMQAGVAAVNLIRKRLNPEENQDTFIPERFTYDIDPIERANVEERAEERDEAVEEAQELQEQNDRLQEEASNYEFQINRLSEKLDNAKTAISDLLTELKYLIAQDRDIEEESYNDVLERSR